MKIALQRVDDGFNMEAVDEGGHKVLMDSSIENGGKNNGVRPMQMIIMGLGGCSAIDVLMILKKQRQEVKDFRIEIEADREKGKEPALWETAHIIFHFTGNIDPDKAARAVELSMNKYCSVAETLRQANTKLTWEVKLNA
ncbi:OsmC family protein [Chitinophaga flava]|uniref:Osmotically inducible protein OsmC n=1 Tax=Chitinophaga flava TaxID=2259036 RepID=A0A365XPC1_9BACT|nr:OsmC family protein [Chitinophaga flava]RBL87990.1 osmotically inducible protein OsmC [Chitinophaga flava]